MWLGALEDDEMTFGSSEDRKCGGRRRKEVRPVEETGARFIDLDPDFNPDMEIQAQVEEWLEAHLVGLRQPAPRKHMPPLGANGVIGADGKAG